MSQRAGSNRKRLLIVDDEPLVHRTLSRALRPHIDVVSKLGPAEALDELGEELAAFDVVLVDVCMQGDADGLDFYRHHLEGLPVTRRPLVIFMTGDERAASMIAGTMNVCCLAKPFTLAELREAMAEHLASAGSDLHPS
ncbi:MAG: response regulator [Labilithrix sp.]|nr:response regulator [Labilithrix sp.]MCW5812839.1 response regulator [Labilithrix sp.]